MGVRPIDRGATVATLEKAQLMAQQYPRLWEQDSGRFLLAMGRTMAGIWAGGERERAQMVFSSLLRDYTGS